MDLSDLIAEYRRRQDDLAEPYHVSDEELARFASEAEREACRGDLLYDDTSDFTTLDVAADAETIAVDARITRIVGASFTPDGSTRGTELDLTGMDWIRGQCDWQHRSCSRPGKLAHLRGAVRLYPLPSVAGTLQLAVYRLPLTDLEADTDEPEIERQHHLGLVDWMVYRASIVRDTEEEDRQRGADALAAFNVRFGPPERADIQRRHNERRRITTRPV